MTTALQAHAPAQAPVALPAIERAEISCLEWGGERRHEGRTVRAAKAIVEGEAVVLMAGSDIHADMMDHICDLFEGEDFTMTAEVSARHAGFDGDGTPRFVTTWLETI